MSMCSFFLLKGFDFQELFGQIVAVTPSILRVNYGKITGHKNENLFFLESSGFWQEPSKDQVFHVQPKKR